MTDAKRDSNYVTTLIGVSSVDGITPVTIYVNPTTHRMLVSISSGLDDLSDVTITSAAQGDILYHNGTAWVNLAAGTSGKFLKTQGAGANPLWDTPASGAAGTDTQVQFNDGGSALGGDAGFTYNKTTNIVTLTGGLITYNATNDGNPEIRLGAADAEELHIQSVYDTGAQTLDYVLFQTDVASATANKGLFRFNVDGTNIIDINDTGIALGADATFDIGTSTVGLNDIHFGLAGVINFDGGDVTITHSANTLTIAGGDLALGANNLTMTGSLGATGARLTKVWATDLEVTNAIAGSVTGNAATVTVADESTDTSCFPLFTTAATGSLGPKTVATLTFNSNTGALSIGTSAVFTAGTIELGAASDTTISRVSAGVIAVEGVNILTVAGGTLTGSVNLGENAGLTYDAALSADGKYSGFVRAGTAGATLAFGDLVYLAAADSRWELADASAASTSGDVLIGICVLAAAADADPTTILLQGFVRADTAFPALTISAPAYISETAGDIVTAQPTTTDAVIRRVGFAWTADELYFNPSNDYITHT